jgi:HK97 family phage major capsid protein
MKNMINKWNGKSNLERLLALTNEDAANKNLIVKTLPEKMLDAYNGEMISRELLLSESVERTGLIQTEIYNSVIAGADQMKCMEEAVMNVKMSTDIMNVPYGSTSVYAGIVMEGAEVPNQYQDYSYKTLTAKKIAQKAPISEEMIADAKFDIIGIELFKLGKNISNYVNRLMIDSMVGNAGNTHDTAGANQGVIAMISAAASIMDDGFAADTCVMHPELWSKVIQDFKPAYNEVAEGVLRSGKVPSPLVGVNSYVCGIAASTATNWDYDTDDDYGGIVYDKLHAAVLGIREPLTVKYAEDPFKMLVAPIAYMRVDGTYVNANAICKIKY